MLFYISIKEIPRICCTLKHHIPIVWQNFEYFFELKGEHSTVRLEGSKVLTRSSEGLTKEAKKRQKTRCPKS
jgi:hypothetical protein